MELDNHGVAVADEDVQLIPVHGIGVRAVELAEGGHNRPSKLHTRVRVDRVACRHLQGVVTHSAVQFIAAGVLGEAGAHAHERAGEEPKPGPEGAIRNLAGDMGAAGRQPRPDLATNNVVRFIAHGRLGVLGEAVRARVGVGHNLEDGNTQ